MRSGLAAPLALVFVLVACSSTTVSPGTGGTPNADAGSGEGGGPAGNADAGADAATDAGAVAPGVEVSLDDVARTVDEAQFGNTLADDTLYFEVNEGGVLACPEAETPNRKLIVSGVPKGAAGATFTEADGVGVSFVDFIGDQIPGNPPTVTATAAKITVVALDGDSEATIDVEATFAGGTAKGRIRAAYCTALSQ